MTEVHTLMTPIHEHTLEVKIPKVVIPHWISVFILSKEPTRKTLLEHLKEQNMRENVCETVHLNTPHHRG